MDEVDDFNNIIFPIGVSFAYEIGTDLGAQIFMISKFCSIYTI